MSNLSACLSNYFAQTDPYVRVKLESSDLTTVIFFMEGISIESVPIIDPKTSEYTDRRLIQLRWNRLGEDKLVSSFLFRVEFDPIEFSRPEIIEFIINIIRYRNNIMK